MQRSKYQLVAPFPWPGGKARIASLAWRRFGEVGNYVEPFFGGGAVLLGRPTPFNSIETINDVDGFVCNFWRAVQADPEQVAHYADWPAVENDLHARHTWLVKHRKKMTARLDGDPEYFNAQIAGWWCWGMCLWIGGGFCSGNGSWAAVPNKQGNLRLRNVGKENTNGHGIHRRIIKLGNNGQGVHSESGRESIRKWIRKLSERLRHARICCGDWSRVMTPTVTFNLGTTAVLLDPPYGDDAGRSDGLYSCDSLTVANKVREWCIENGDNRDLRIALCGYDGEHKMPEGWTRYEWKAKGGFSGKCLTGDEANSRNELIWFSPHCLRPKRLGFFG